MSQKTFSEKARPVSEKSKPGYKGKNFRESKVYKAPKKAEYKNKYKDFVDNPTKFADTKEKKVADTVKRSADKVSEKINRLKDSKIVPENYKNFLSKIGAEKNRKLARLVPIILLSLTSLALKNKTLFKTFGLAYRESTSKDTDPFKSKILSFIRAYIDIFNKLNLFEKSELSFTFLTVFLDDIPSVFRDYSDISDINHIVIMKHLSKNAAEIVKLGDSSEKGGVDKKSLLELQAKLDLIILKNNQSYTKDAQEKIINDKKEEDNKKLLELILEAMKKK